MIKKRLFTPGPTEVPPEVLIEMAKPIFHHRTEQFREMFGQVTEGLKKIFMTDNDVLTLTSSGTAGMESAIVCACTPGEKVLIANGGKFGDRWVEVARRVNLDVDEVKLDWGTAISPETVGDKLSTGDYSAVILVHSETSTGTACDIEAIAKVVGQTDAILIADCITSLGALPLLTDEWGVDIVVSGSQKALMMPPGLAFVSVSQKAWKRIESITPPGVYLDLRAYRKSLANNDTPYTAAVSLIRGLKVAIEMILDIGMETIWARTARLAQATRSAAEALGLKLFSSQPSDSVSCFWLPEGVSDKQFRGILRDKYGCSVAGGQGDLKGKVFRISHMGYVDPVETIGLIAAIEYALAECGIAVEIGRGVSAAAKVLKDWK